MNLKKNVQSKILGKMKIIFMKLKYSMIIVWLITKNTLSVVIIALIIFIPVIVWPLLMGWPEPYCYVAYALWICWLIVSLAVAGIIGYLREVHAEK